MQPAIAMATAASVHIHHLTGSPARTHAHTHPSRSLPLSLSFSLSLAIKRMVTPSCPRLKTEVLTNEKTKHGKEAETSKSCCLPHHPLPPEGGQWTPLLKTKDP